MMFSPQPLPQPLPPHSVASERRMMACYVRVRTQTGTTHCYYALAGSTCEAVMQAIDHFGRCKVSASPVYPDRPAGFGVAEGRLE